MGDEVVPATSGAGQNDLKACNGVAGSDEIPSAGLDNNTAVPDIPQAQQDQPALIQQGFSSQFDMIQSPPPMGRAGPYNMAPMVNALPQMGYRQNHYPQGAQQRYPSTASPSVMHQMSHMPQFPGPSMPIANHEYYIQPHASPYYGTNQVPSTQAQQSMPPRPAMSYYPTPVMVNHPSTGYYYHHPPGAQYHGQPQPVHANMMNGQYMVGSPTSPSDPRIFGQPLGDDHNTLPRRGQNHNEIDQRQDTVRGPPRKPRQSGHAIWIGNLPPQTDLMNLVHHVCKEAPGLESLFLISKSNCAFANFKDELTCVAAQQKLHDSKFQTVRLVSRLRKSTVEGVSGVTAPTGPAASTNNVPVPTDQTTHKITPPDSDRSTPSANQSTPSSRHSPEMEGSLKQDKFFILKSLTVEDLELSVRTGIWATQSHNEQSLNKAFKAADNVYLVFSANKSGEYFGYARMTSEIDEDPAAAIEFAPKAQATTELDLPKAIPTDATEHAPKGRIIDDSARGTIFWETDRGDAENESEIESDNETGSNKSGAAEDGTQTWGKPFKLEWLSTNRLPFYRTRGLRNPWNSNREVKIARDGTELEPSVGRRLLGLFNRIQSPVTLPAPLRPPMGMIPGYVQVRPYGR